MERNQIIGEVFYYKHYYLDFFKKLNPEAQKKFNWTIQLMITLEKIPKKYFKHVTSTKGIFEVRVEVSSDIYRVFSFFDKGKLIILLNAFQKKTHKTPMKEIQLADRLMREYYNEQQ